MSPRISAVTVSTPSVQLAPVLKRPLVRRGPGSGGSLWPLGLLLAIAGIAALKADAGADAWPLAVLAAVPLVALLAGVTGGFSWEPATARGRRTCRIVRDRRPVLLSAVIRVLPGRSPRIIGRRRPGGVQSAVGQHGLARPRPARLIRPYLPA